MKIGGIVFLMLEVALIGFLSGYIYHRDIKTKPIKIDPDNYTYKQVGSAIVIFDRENKDSIFCKLRSDSYLRFRCLENGIVYTYKGDTTK